MLAVFPLSLCHHRTAHTFYQGVLLTYLSQKNLVNDKHKNNGAIFSQMDETESIVLNLCEMAVQAASVFTIAVIIGSPYKRQIIVGHFLS